MFQWAGKTSWELKNENMWTLKFKSNEPWKTETHFEPIEVNFCFLNGLPRRRQAYRFWLTLKKNPKSKDVFDSCSNINIIFMYFLCLFDDFWEYIIMYHDFQTCEVAIALYRQ